MLLLLLTLPFFSGLALRPNKKLKNNVLNITLIYYSNTHKQCDQFRNIDYTIYNKNSIKCQIHVNNFNTHLRRIDQFQLKVESNLLLCFCFVLP